MIKCQRVTQDAAGESSEKDLGPLRRIGYGHFDIAHLKNSVCVVLGLCS